MRSGHSACHDVIDVVSTGATILAVAGSAILILMATASRARASEAIACTDPYAAMALGMAIAISGIFVLLVAAVLVGHILASRTSEPQSWTDYEDEDQRDNSCGPSWHVSPEDDVRRAQR